MIKKEKSKKCLYLSWQLNRNPRKILKKMIKIKLNPKKKKNQKNQVKVK
jgi:hypothetical protein